MNPSESDLRLIEPAAPEVLLPATGVWPWLLGGLLLAVFLVVAIALIRYQRRMAATPDARALRQAAFREALAELEKSAAADDREAAVRASLVIRRYLSVAAGDPALFETHEEFVARHNALAALQPNAREAAAEGFTRLASVKYGPPRPAGDPQQVFGESRRLLETLHHGFVA